MTLPLFLRELLQRALDDGAVVGVQSAVPSAISVLTSSRKLAAVFLGSKMFMLFTCQSAIDKPHRTELNFRRKEADFNFLSKMEAGIKNGGSMRERVVLEQSSGKILIRQ